MLRAALVADADEARAVAQPFREAVTHAAARPVRDGRFFPKRHREGAAARDERERRAVGSRRHVFETVVDFDEAARRLRRCRRRVDLGIRHGIRRGIQQRDARSRRVGDRAGRRSMESERKYSVFVSYGATYRCRRPSPSTCYRRLRDRKERRRGPPIHMGQTGFPTSETSRAKMPPSPSTQRSPAVPPL